MSKIRKMIIIFSIIILLFSTISCKEKSTNNDTSGSENILYTLDYDGIAGLYCYIKMQTKFMWIEMYINGKHVSHRELAGYTYIPVEDIPSELFDLEIRVFNVWRKLLHKETYNNVLTYNAEGKVKLEMIPFDVEHLFVFNCKDIEDISVLEKTPNLKSLYLRHCNTIDLTSIINLRELKVLDIYNTRIKNMNALANYKNLEFLNIGSAQVEDISVLKELKDLRCLVISHNRVSDISSLSHLINLEYVRASNNKIVNVEALRDMRKLQYLVLSSNQIQNVEPLGEVISLKDLYIANNKITDITPLAKLKNLNYLNISRNKIQDYSALDEAGIEYEK